MNKTKIETCDVTDNIVTGCYGPNGSEAKPARCVYCYAQQMATRLRGRFGYPSDDPFRPTFHRDRVSKADAFLRKARKPLKVFEGDMTDLWASWVPFTWQAEVVALACRHPRHVFQFFTKQPENYARWNPWPPNCWLIASVDVPARLEYTLVALDACEAAVRGISFEPLLGDMAERMLLLAWRKPLPLEWAIIGAQTGRGAKPVDAKWVSSLSMRLHMAGVPVFHKNSLREVTGAAFRQEWPKPRAMRRSYEDARPCVHGCEIGGIVVRQEQPSDEPKKQKKRKKSKKIVMRPKPPPLSLEDAQPKFHVRAGRESVWSFLSGGMSDG